MGLPRVLHDWVINTHTYLEHLGVHSQLCQEPTSPTGRLPPAPETPRARPCPPEGWHWLWDTPPCSQPSGVTHQWTSNSAETHPREGSALGCFVTQPPQPQANILSVSGASQRWLGLLLAHRAMEQNREPQSEPTQTWAVNPWQRRQDYVQWEKDSLSISGTGGLPLWSGG